MANGRLEAQYTVPTGGWSVAVTITAIGGPFTCTIAAGTYFPTALLTAFQTALDGASGGDGAFTVSAGTGESGTGLVTIAHAVQTFSLTWTSTDLRDSLGFTADLTPAAASFSGTKHFRGVWLPTYAINAPRGTDAGYTDTDRSEMTTPGGTVTSLVYQSSRVKLPEVTWAIVTARRALVTQEVTVGESFEQWWLDTHSGLRTYFSTSPQVRLYWSADAGTYHTFYLTGRFDTSLQRAGDGDWIGIWSVSINGYKVPGS